MKTLKITYKIDELEQLINEIEPLHITNLRFTEECNYTNRILLGYFDSYSVSFDAYGYHFHGIFDPRGAVMKMVSLNIDILTPEQIAKGLTWEQGKKLLDLKDNILVQIAHEANKRGLIKEKYKHVPLFVPQLRRKISNIIREVTPDTDAA